MATNLTAKQESFAQAIVDGLNQSDAYRHAYETGNMKPETVWNNAYMLMQDSEVSARIQALRDQVADASTAARAWNVDRIVQESETNLRLGRFLGQIGAANGAITTIGKATGILTDKVDINVTHTLKLGLTLEELEARVQRLDALEAGVVEGTVVDAEESE